MEIIESVIWVYLVFQAVNFGRWVMETWTESRSLRRLISGFWDHQMICSPCSSFWIAFAIAMINSYFNSQFLTPIQIAGATSLAFYVLSSFSPLSLSK